MRHKVAGRKLGRTTSHRLSLLRNQVTDLLRYDKLTTTEPKAREVKPLAEKVITLGKAGSLAARRQALRTVTDREVVEKVFTTLAKRYAERHGGYTRLLKLGPRAGDNAAMALLELVE